VDPCGLITNKMMMMIKVLQSFASKRQFYIEHFPRIVFIYIYLGIIIGASSVAFLAILGTTWGYGRALDRVQWRAHVPRAPLICTRVAFSIPTVTAKVRADANTMSWVTVSSIGRQVRWNAIVIQFIPLAAIVNFRRGMAGRRSGLAGRKTTYQRRQRYCRCPSQIQSSGLRQQPVLWAINSGSVNADVCRSGPWTSVVRPWTITRSALTSAISRCSPANARYTAVDPPRKK